VASFVGLLPAEDPRLVILVVIDEPKTDVYGGLVAAPAFKEIALQAMPYLAVPPSRLTPVAEVNPRGRGAAPQRTKGEPRGEVVATLARMDVVTEETAEGAVRVPDVSGLSGRRAVAQVLGAALEPRVTGSGRVVAQHPTAGSLVDKGSRVTLELAGYLPTSTW
jgi:cell division protein FtsI (penicillin-binding protein 3)